MTSVMHPGVTSSSKLSTANSEKQSSTEAFGDQISINLLLGECEHKLVEFSEDPARDIFDHSLKSS